MTLATLQQLRSFNEGEHPLNLEPGQIAFNMAEENWQVDKDDYQLYMYIGNSSNQRIDDGGTVLSSGGDVGKGWIRYGLRNINIAGDNTVYGDFSIAGAKLKVESNGASLAELVLPRESMTPTSGTDVGSIRWNTQASALQAWSGAKWDTTSKVVVSTTVPVSPSNGDLWLDAGPPAILRVYVVPASGPASWVSATNTESATALQPGNGVSANNLNQIELINVGTF